MNSRNQRNANEPISLDRAARWSTKWESLDLPSTEGRLTRLYWLRQFAEMCGPEIPQSWRRFLADEIDLGERRQAGLVFRESDLEPETTTVEEVTIFAGQYEATDEDIPF